MGTGGTIQGPNLPIREFSILPKDTSTCGLEEPGMEPQIFRLADDPLCLLSHSRPRNRMLLSESWSQVLSFFVIHVYFASKFVLVYHYHYYYCYCRCCYLSFVIYLCEAWHPPIAAHSFNPPVDPGSNLIRFQMFLYQKYGLLSSNCLKITWMVPYYTLCK